MVEGEVVEGVDEHVDELGAPPPMPRLRSLALAFLVGALVVSGWSLTYQFQPRPEVEPQVINDVSGTLQAP